MFLLTGYLALKDPQILEDKNRDYYIKKITAAIPSPKIGIMLYRADEKDQLAMEKLFPIKLFEIIDQHLKEASSFSFHKQLAQWLNTDKVLHNKRFDYDNTEEPLCHELHKCAHNKEFLQGNVAACNEYYQKRCTI